MANKGCGFSRPSFPPSNHASRHGLSRERKLKKKKQVHSWLGIIKTCNIHSRGLSYLGNGTVLEGHMGQIWLKHLIPVGLVLEEICSGHQTEQRESWSSGFSCEAALPPCRQKDGLRAKQGLEKSLREVAVCATRTLLFVGEMVWLLSLGFPICKAAMKRPYFICCPRSP